MPKTKARKRQEGAGKPPPVPAVRTLAQAMQHYWDDHGRYTVSPVRIEVAWGKIGPTLGNDLIGPSLYAKTAAYAQKQFAKGISPATVRRDLTAAVVAPLRHCFKLGLITSLPPIYTISQKPNPRKRILQDGEIAAIIEASREWPWLFKTVMLLAYTAQRIKAVMELEWDQVDLATQVIDFNKKTDHFAPRRKGRGVVPIPDELFAYMVEWHRATTDNGTRAPRQPRVVGELPAATYFWWRRLMNKAGITNAPEVTPHIMRHSIATKLVREGKDIRLVQQLLGHKSLKTTESTYVHNSPEMIREGVAGLTFSK